MITTVTTVTTVTTIAALGFTAVTGVAAVGTLIFFLATRELASASHSRYIARFAIVGILPLVIAFATIAAVKIAEVI